MSGLVAKNISVQILALLVILVTCNSVCASEPTLFAGASYWAGFTEYWTAYLKKQQGIVLGILGLGAVALIIITRGSSQRK